MKASTYFALLAEFGTAQIPLEAMCERYFGLSPDKAKAKAARGELPVQPIRLAGQKSPWLVPAERLAEHIDKQMGRAA